MDFWKQAMLILEILLKPAPENIQTRHHVFGSRIFWTSDRHHLTCHAGEFHLGNLYCHVDIIFDKFFFVAAESACLRFLAKRFLAEGNGFTTGTRDKVLEDFFSLCFGCVILKNEPFLGLALPNKNKTKKCIFRAPKNNHTCLSFHDNL